MSAILAGGSGDTASRDCKEGFINWDKISLLCHTIGDKGKLTIMEISPTWGLQTGKSGPLQDDKIIPKNVL